ncbi:maltooligosyl trehalose hydrolase [Roseimicrobium gellanilyticum]|uniref:Malto-oligosyltrehalose trehalohydrolase n=1 Tax=Roseimicrobium gellanilyticum TaxID=748857 RepID=A0A366HI81_9BACT|nr:malto-oligosyltrehalose trehalohydrolase [Roseimicrobium gellanilyticum]RBP42421.1 maltooligosyl trehalose hydrolase [Roseimicrobium gellanilyticum]
MSESQKDTQLRNHQTAMPRTYPVGPELHGDRGARFRVWAPSRKEVAVLVGGDATRESHATRQMLEPEKDGYFSGLVPGATPGMLYRFDVESGAFPDPASRFQPSGPHGPSQLIDSSAFPWTDEDWPGVPQEGQVIYEMHLGTFTPEGTWAAAAAQLPELALLGITLLEIMPVADFPGERGWGYDGVNLFAPTRLYGSPDDMRAFVNEAHRHGIGVILDVVYNHLGPNGNYLGQFSPYYVHHKRISEWGDALNFDGENSGPVREFFCTNAEYWIREFHLDGLRLDATQQIFDDSEEHILTELTRRARAAGSPRKIYIVAENESQHSKLVRPSARGGYGLDSIWNDDFHHSAMVAMTGRNEAYFTDYRGWAQEFVASAKWGFLYQGQYYQWQKKQRGTPCLDLEPWNFVTFLQNHDQIANSLWGQRIHNMANRATLRALTALLLLGPSTPMLFQGQEFASSSRFLYFTDHDADLATCIGEGRVKFLEQFPGIATDKARAVLSDPQSDETFQKCVLDFSERQKNEEMYRLHRDLIQLRKNDPLLGKVKRGEYDGAPLGRNALVLRCFGREQNDRLLIVNYGPAMDFDPAPEPLLAPVDGCTWHLHWSSEDPSYGGSGTPAFESVENWTVPAMSAVVLIPAKP